MRGKAEAGRRERMAVKEGSDANLEWGISKEEMETSGHIKNIFEMEPVRLAVGIGKEGINNVY